MDGACANLSLIQTCRLILNMRSLRDMVDGTSLVELSTVLTMGEGQTHFLDER